MLADRQSGSTGAINYRQEAQTVLNAIWSNVQGRTLQQEDYYGNSLKMLTMIGISGRWAKPQ